MTDFEKAIRFLCIGELKENDNKAKCYRYDAIKEVVRGNKDIESKYAKKFDKLIDML